MSVWGKLKKLTTPEPWQPPQGLTINEAGIPLGIPEGTILRESEDADYLWCDKVVSPQLDPQLFYPVTLLNKGNAVWVMMNGQRVSVVAQRALPLAVKALTLAGGKQAPGMLEPGNPDRKTSRILVRVA